MTDTPPPDPAAPLRPANPVRRTAARAARAGVSLIWMVPVVALLVTLALAWNAYTGRGTLISVAFTDATGITPGETTLRFHEVPVGKVEAVRFTADLQKVVVDIRVESQLAEYIDDDAQFWIVRPQVSTQGISRLDTVLTGAFIEGWWDADPGPATQTIHTGLDRPPLTLSTEKGTWVVLSSDSAKGMAEGAPIFYRGVAVGRMQDLRLSDRDESVIADAFIEAPHDRRLTSETVFWDTSGFSVTLGTQGVALNVNSLSSLLQGGAEFATLGSGGQPVRAGHVFRLHPDLATARNSLFEEPAENELRLTVLMNEAVRGLTEGADVQFQGLTVGRVTDLAVRVVPGRAEARQVLQDITIAVSPQRLGLPEDAGPAEALSFLAGRVAQGLRARVAGAGLFGTSLMVELADVPEAPAAQIVADAKPYPVIPSAPPDLSDITASAQGLMTRIGNLKLEELLKSATDMMNSVTAIASSQDTRAIPESLRRTIDEAQATVTDLRGAAQELRDRGTFANIAGAAEKADRIAGKLDGAADRIPGIVDSLDTATTSIRDVDFAGIAADARAALADLRAVVGSDAAKALPDRLASAMDRLGTAADEIGAIAAEVREGGAAGQVRRMVDEAAAAAEAVRLAAADVPAMVEQVDSAAASVEEFDFAGISAEARAIVTDLRAMLGSEDAEQLPRNLSDTLKAASGLLNDLREGGAAGNLNATLASARRAMDEVAQAARSLPQLSQRFQMLAARAESVIAAYGGGGAFNTETIGTMRSLRRAAEAFGSLATTIERNPRAFLLGR